VEAEREILAKREVDVERSLAFIVDEFRKGMEAVARIPPPAVTLFGSARVAPEAPFYAMARATGKAFAEAGFSVVTGGGPGLMEAANRGAREGGGYSAGFNIELPHEQFANAYLDLSLTFKHFYARKVMFVRAAEGFVVLPGGFGTLDELYEALILIQTGKIRHFPVVLLGTDYWRGLLEWTRERQLAQGMIAQADLDLLSLTDDPAEAVRQVRACLEGTCGHAGAAGPGTLPVGS
jgi:uncharacterized protein (TIGR00730 family)